MKVIIIVQRITLFAVLLLGLLVSQPAIAQEKFCHTEPLGAVHFSAESSHLWESQKAKLKIFVKEIAQSTCTIAYVRGYTAKFIWTFDSHKHRMQLSKERALVVHEFIQNRLDRLGSKIELRASWFAARRPVATNETADGRAKNRRVVISLLSADEN